MKPRGRLFRDGREQPEALAHGCANCCERQELLDDPRFATISLRLANREALIEELEKSVPPARPSD